MTASSVRGFLPDNCLLNLEDDDNDTLDLVTDVNTSQTIILYMILKM